MTSFSQLRERATEFVAEWAQWGEVLILAPVRAAADEVALEACGDALIGVYARAFRELAMELAAAELNRRALVPIGKVVREALAARVVANALREGALQYLGPVANLPGFPRALAATFEELRLNSVTGPQLRECGESGPDLAWLLGAYESELAARGFADHAARVALASEAAKGWVEGRAVVVVDLAPRTRAERELVGTLLKSARAHLELRVERNNGEGSRRALPNGGGSDGLTERRELEGLKDSGWQAEAPAPQIRDDLGSEQRSEGLTDSGWQAKAPAPQMRDDLGSEQRFEALKDPGWQAEAPAPQMRGDLRNEQRLEGLKDSGWQAEAPAPPSAGNATSLESLQRYIFSTEPVPPLPEDTSVEIFSTSGEALECVEIARRIASAAERGVAFDQIAILLRSPERYQPLVAEGLRRAGIPMFAARGSRRPDVAGRSLLALLHCAEERLSASRFAEYLSLGQMPEAEEPRSPAFWERLLVDAAVIGSAERWETRLNGLREELHRKHSAEQDEDVRSRIDANISALDSLRSFAMPLITRLAALPERAVWGEWIAALSALAESALQEPAQVLALLDELEPLSEIGPVSLAEVLLVLGPRLQTLTAVSSESRYGKVWVGGIEEARGMAFRMVFLPGVNEGLFPRPPAEDPLLLAAQRVALGVELRADDTELFRMAAACATEQLALSFSRLDLLTGRERVPSFYTFAAHRAAGARETDVREFERRARCATGTRIGWPAPLHAADAIDDAEFDLATLAPLTKGSGQYLKSLPGRAVASLRARWMRWHRPWRAVDGLIIEEVGSDALARYRLTERAWSASQLQQYARCPYRFALRGIFGLHAAASPAPIQRMDPAQRGELYHRVQFELLRDGGEPTLERLDEVLEREAARAEAELAPAIPEIWRAEVQALRADLRGWLQQKALREPEWKAEFAELAFGLADVSNRDSHSRSEPVTLPGGYRLRGAIDLIERHPSGALRVVDHKTGRIPEPRPEIAGRGEILQPLLYALAAEQLLGEPVSNARLYYSTIAQNYTTMDVPINDWTRRRVQHGLQIIDGAIADGFLPAAPRKDGCKSCEYLPVCGPYEEERVVEKSQAELKGIKEMRGWK